jgi:hypothetical protein
MSGTHVMAGVLLRIVRGGKFESAAVVRISEISLLQRLHRPPDGSVAKTEKDKLEKVVTESKQCHAL